MATTKISGLTAVSTAISGSDLLNVSKDQGGGTYASQKGTLAQIGTYVQNNVTVNTSSVTQMIFVTGSVTNASHYLLFINTSSTPYHDPRSDGSSRLLTYNPSTNILTSMYVSASQITASTFSGTASYSISSSYSTTSSLATGLYSVGGIFQKSTSSIVAFTTLTSQSLNLNQKLIVYIANNAVTFTSGSSITLPTTMSAGNDYGVYATYDGGLYATTSSYTSYFPPSNYNVNNSLLIGGFYFAHSGSSTITTVSHSRASNVAYFTCSQSPGLNTNDTIDMTLVTDTTYYAIDAPITILATTNSFSYTNSGSDSAVAADNTGRIWKTNNNGVIAQYSLWDLKFKPACSNPRGMVLVDNRFWVDVWLTGVNYNTTGSSHKGDIIADGSSASFVSPNMGGNGVTKYTGCTWFQANEMVSYVGKKLLSYVDYSIAAYGTTEASSFGTDPNANCRCIGYLSKWGMEQASGVMYIWGSDFNFRYDQVAATSYTSITRSLSSGSIASVTCSAAHGLGSGDIITTTTFGNAAYNRVLTSVVSVPSTTALTYNVLSGSTPEPATIDTAGKIFVGVPTTPVYGYSNNTEGRGQIYTEGTYGQAIAGVYGGYWNIGACAGSRYSHWSIYIWSYNLSVGVRGRCDHIVVP